MTPVVRATRRSMTGMSRAAPGVDVVPGIGRAFRRIAIARALPERATARSRYRLRGPTRPQPKAS